MIQNLKIGITCAVKTYDDSIWTNGIKQNVMYLADLLVKSKNNYKVTLLNLFDIDFSQKRPEYLKNYDIKFFDAHFHKMDILIIMGSIIPEIYLKLFRSLGKKIVYYKCGNDYIYLIETLLFKEGATEDYSTEFDEVWYVPQQYELNHSYYSIVYRCPSLPVPFIWHHKYIDEDIAFYKKEKPTDVYVPKEKKTIGILEPNLNVVKTCTVPLLITEQCYRGAIGKKYIDKLRITNSNTISKDKKFLSLVKKFDLTLDNKIIYENRFRTTYMLVKNIDMIISHQLFNPLNYLYLDAVYMGCPLLHNATLCKDIGYYYEGSDAIKGARALEIILENHDKNIVEYNKRNTRALWKYNIENPILIEQYDILLEGLMKGTNKKLVYDWQNNIFKP